MRFPRIVLNRRLFSSPVSLAIVAFVLLYCSAVLFVREISWRDPRSWFFDPDPAYEPIYSSVRLQQAEEYLANASTEAFRKHRQHSDKIPELFVGLVSIARVGARYLHIAVASLVEG